MQGTLDFTNYSAYKYNESILDKLKSICEPLELLGIKAFCYGRLFKDGTYLRLGTNKDWNQYVFQNVFSYTPTFQKVINEAEINKFHCFLWPLANYENDTLLSQLYNLNIWHGINVIENLGNSIECYGFAADRYTDNMGNFYLNNKELLEQFIIYFRVKAKDLIDSTNKEKLCFLNSPLEDYVSLKSENEKRIKDYINLIKVARTPVISKEGKVIYLSEQQNKCLLSLKEGKTTKEIAKDLNLSPRTVETYINQVKIKTGFQRKSELICMVTKK